MSKTREGRLGYRVTIRDPYQTVQAGTCDAIVLFGMRFLDGKAKDYATEFLATIADDKGIGPISPTNLIKIWILIGEEMRKHVDKRSGGGALISRQLNELIRTFTDAIQGDRQGPDKDQK